MWKVVRLLILLPCVIGYASAAQMPVLERLLNGAKMGAHTTQRDENRFATVQPGQPVGQTFVVSERCVEVFRIAIWQAFWHETWQPDEMLVLTLWDSPQKRFSYGRCAIPYARRMWEGAVPMFTLEAKVQPGRSYYFELTVETEPLRPAVVPREWTLGGERPGFAGGDRVLAGIGIASDDYPDGAAYVGGAAQGYDLWFEIHEIHQVERDQLYAEAFRPFNLDYPPLQPVREAVERKDWEEAVRRLVAHFESREDLIPPELREPRYDPEFDTREADLAAEAKVLLPDGTTVDLGPHWSHYILWPERGGVGLTRAGLRRPLAAGYARTGNEKYARAFSQMLYHLFQQCPSPLKAGVWKPDQKIPGALPPGLAGGSMWSALSIGARLGHGLTYYGRFVRSPHFPLEIRAAFLFNLAEMAEVLERMEAGGNWETQMADTLVELGQVYPEFRGAKRWLEQGVQRLIENALATVHPDGVLGEPTMGYHLLVMGRYRNLVAQSQQLNIQLPPEMVSLTEKMHEYVMYSTLPDGTLPVWGDGNPPMRPDMLAQAADLFRREDFRYVGTGGRQGTPPAKTSAGFPHGGFFYLRSFWGPDAHYMGIRCGPHGSHGHWDQLSLIVASYGNLLLIDPGVHIYGTPEAQELMHTRSHNTVTVDERRTLSGGILRAWATGSRLDYFAGHTEGFEGLTHVKHHRRVWLLKPEGDFGGFWLVRDDVTGTGEHEAQLWFRFAKVEVQADEERRAVWTRTEGGNLLVLPVDQGDLNLALTRGIAVPPGVHRLTEVPVARFSRRGSLPLAFTSLLIPYRGSAPPAVKAFSLPVTPAGSGADAVWVETGSRAFLIFGEAVAPPSPLPLRKVTLPDRSEAQVCAQSVVLEFRRQGGKWQATALLGVQVQQVNLQGRNLWRRSEQAADMVEVDLSSRQ
ncbi:MAG: heparinase II/III family protein [bacterium]|nr:heparinase II/III family protein [bacterium]